MAPTSCHQPRDARDRRVRRHPADHDVVVVDEGHELVDRATRGRHRRADRVCRRRRAAPAGSGEVRSSRPPTHALAQLAGQALEEAAGRAVSRGRLTALTGLLFDAGWVALRDIGAHGRCPKAGGPADRTATGDRPVDAGTHAGACGSRGSCTEIAGRIVSAGGRPTWLWVSAAGTRRPASLHRAPLSVAGLLRDLLFAHATIVLTSATLTGGPSSGRRDGPGRGARRPGLRHRLRQRSLRHRGLRR